MIARSAPALLLIACGPSFWGQTDGFRDQIADRCKTEASCEDADLEARRRMRECKPNTIGQVRCSDAQADIEEVRRRLGRFREARAEDDRQQREARRATEMQEQQRAKDAAAIAAKERHGAETLRAAIGACPRQMSTRPCDQIDTTSSEVHAQCVADCTVEIGRATESVYRSALRECVDGQVDSLGRDAPDCRFRLPVGASIDLAERRDACAKECLEQAKPLVARARQAAPPAAPARAPAAPKQSGGGTRALCCDGVPSPTCECPGHQGCCSHHGGVCGCTN